MSGGAGHGSTSTMVAHLSMTPAFNAIADAPCSVLIAVACASTNSAAACKHDAVALSDPERPWI